MGKTINTTTRRQMLLGAVSVSALAACAPKATPAKRGAQKAPNIVFILADDLGYADLSCYGRRDFETPNLDGLANQGLKLTSAYANSASCSPTRTALMSGQYQQRLSVGLVEPLAGEDVGYPTAHPSLPSLLKQAGYQTSLVGKWHLGLLPKYGPLQSGYDHFWGFRDGAIDYFRHEFLGTDLWDGDVKVEEVGYLTDLLGDRACREIETLSANCPSSDNLRQMAA